MIHPRRRLPLSNKKGGEPELPRINFPGYSGRERLKNISWEEFFKKFDEKHLTFLYQEKKQSGEESRFWKVISEEETSKAETNK